MKRSENVVKRSLPMMIAAYYLSRCGEQVPGGQSKPPTALGVGTWKAAYDFFFNTLGDGRTRPQFRNSIKNARDTFDILFENGRIGWIDKDGQQPSLSTGFLRIHEEWKSRQDQDIEAFALGLQADTPFAFSDETNLLEARTEGGEKVFISIRRERDAKLRVDALSMHGFDCMACGFNFGKFYGEIGKGFIEVHHVVPLSEAGRTETNPETDLIVLCSNCHRIIHRQNGICLSLKELKAHVQTEAVS